MGKKTIEFDAHKKVMKPSEVSFTTKKGKEVDFVAEKKVEVPVHVKFQAKK
jgi:predicted AAA+ superfamily ATPase